MESLISEQYNIPADKMIIMLRHESAYNRSIRAEYFNMDWRKDKKINSCSKLTHGTILFVEEGDPNASFDTF